MKVHGKKILSFPCGDIEKEQLDCDFYFSDDNHDFLIEISDFPMHKAFELLENNCSIHRDYLYCIDENDEVFTLYDCFIIPMQIPVKQVKIIWNKCLLGYHISDYQTEKVSLAKYIVKSEKFSINMFIGKERIDVLNGKVHISTDWYQEEGRFVGVQLCIEPEEALSILELEKIVLRFLEIYALLLGFFPKVESRKMISDSVKSFYFIESFVAYGKTAKSNIKLDYVFDKKDEIDFSGVYNNWWNLREKEVVTFNLFSYLTTETSPVQEVPIATCIQCFEGYFRIHHSDSILRFSKSAKDTLVGEVLRLLYESDNLKKVCEENQIEIANVVESYRGMSGHIHEYSLKEIIEFAINRSENALKLFEYERSNLADNKKSLMHIFIQKATGHRNWLSHLVEQKRRFIGDEILLADAKLRLLFRLTLMYDIGLEVTEQSLDKVIYMVNRWYENHKYQ